MRRSLATFLGAAIVVAVAGQVGAGPAMAAEAVKIAGPAVTSPAVAARAVAAPAVASPAPAVASPAAVPPVVAGPAPDGGVPGGNRNVCGTNYATIDLGRGDYFNVYNEQDHLSCVKAEKSVLSWTVTKRGGSVKGWEYPHIGSGIEWGRYTCYDGRSAYPSSPGSRCMRYPVREKYDGTPLTSVQFWPHLANGNVAYDIWFNKTNVSPSSLGQNNGAEIMVWLMHPGITEPWSRICWRTKIQGLWYDAMCWLTARGGARWNYVAYIAEKQTRTLTPTWLNGFFRDAIRHGKVRQDWWLTSIDFGAEINSGGIGFAVKSYSLTDVR